MPVITISDACAAELRLALGSAPAPSGTPTPPQDAPPPVVPPVASITLPPEFAGLPSVSSTLPWSAGINRIVSPQGFRDGAVWRVSFTTGASTARPARLQGAEYAPSQPAPREWALIRVSDGKVAASGKSSPTIACLMNVGYTAPFMPTLLPSTGYMLLVKNQTGTGGRMFMDLIL